MVRGAVYAVAGAKGGVGKTTTSLNLGAALAAAGRSVAVVELDLAMANTADFLALDVDPETDTTLHDVLAGDASVDEAVYDADDGFAVVPSGTTLDGFAGVDVDRIGDVLATLRGQYDVLLLDTGAGLSHETLLPLALAAETVLVSSPRVASVRDVEKTKQLTERVGGTVAGAVFVRSGTGTSPPVDRIATFLDVPLLGHVPEDDAVPASQDVGRPVVAQSPGSPAAEAYRAIARRLDDRDVAVPDERRVASNAVRARAETAKHRDGFVFPGRDESDDDSMAEGDESDATDESDDDSTAGGDESDAMDETDATESTEATVRSEEETTNGESDEDGSRDVDESDEDEAPSTTDVSRQDDTTDASGEEGRSASPTDPTARDRGDRIGDEDENEEGIRGRLGAVVRAVRGPF
ncbi:septum site-determining protein MinD [Halogranum amylolyticum]|uniref:Septum site-determining protein MinD n=1 Tax=Halogranum amylolyticum TaxID=660520 RepID=A0A1H8PFE0_9EURY|nr:P-loop NTPase [Halogranum amylolyticum]SEO40273.1 septum site-determining protein MinD [Halogranum amylolyticum]